jgi:hypothetical protein
MQPDALLVELAKKLRVRALVPDPDGCVRLRFADGVAVELRFPARGQMFAEAEIEKLPKAPAEIEATMRRWLRRALGSLRNRPETLALDEAGGRLVIWRRIMIDEPGFADIESELTDFLDEVDAWRNAAEAPRSVGPMTMMLFP